MGLAAADWEKINGCLVRLYQELDAARHAQVLLEVLNELVPADSIALNYFKPPNDLTALTLPADIASPAQVKKVGQYSHQSPFGVYYVTTADASWKMTTDFMPVEEFHKLDIYQHALRELGVNQQCGGILGVVDGVFHIITIHRTHQAFTEHDRTLLNALHPHLVTSFLNAMMVSRANRSITQLKAVMETAPGAYGYFNADGTLAWQQPRAQEWLLEFFPTEVKSAANVPQPIANLVHQSRTEDATPKVLMQPGTTEILATFLSPSPLSGWILRLERKPKYQKPHFQPLTQLTPRENEVLRWMVEGKRNGEIATILQKSPRTVEKQVQSILAKLAVENRASAIIRAMELTAASAAAV